MKLKLGYAILLGFIVLIAAASVYVGNTLAPSPGKPKPVNVTRLARALRNVYNQRATAQHVPVRAVAGSCKPYKALYECRLILLAAPSGVHCSRLYVKASSKGFKVVSFGADPVCPEGDKL